jgi:nucleotide-binding universal stress UspA family protein
MSTADRGVRPFVLVGVDGSEDGLRAVTYAMWEARAGGADVRLVAVVDEKAPAPGLWEIVASPDALRTVGEGYVRQGRDLLAELDFPADRVASEVVLGRPGETLVSMSADAHLLVVGRRAITGLERMFVGSTSVFVAEHARCPVIVISAASTPHKTGRKRRIAVAVDAGPLYRAELEWAFAEAAGRQARLLVVHVAPDAHGGHTPAFVEALRAELDDQLRPFRAQHPAVDVEVHVGLGATVHELVAVSATVDLLILGIHHDHPGLGGSVRGVMAHAHCPVGITR